MDHQKFVRSIPGRDGLEPREVINEENPVFSFENTGFSQVGLAGFEPTTSTTPR